MNYSKEVFKKQWGKIYYLWFLFSLISFATVLILILSMKLTVGLKNGFSVFLLTIEIFIFFSIFISTCFYVSRQVSCKKCTLHFAGNDIYYNEVLYDGYDPEANYKRKVNIYHTSNPTFSKITNRYFIISGTIEKDIEKRLDNYSRPSNPKIVQTVKIRRIFKEDEEIIKRGLLED